MQNSVLYLQERLARPEQGKFITELAVSKIISENLVAKDSTWTFYGGVKKYLQKNVSWL